LRPAIPSTGPTSKRGDANNNSGREHDFSGPAGGKVSDEVTGGRPTLGGTSGVKVTATEKKKKQKQK